MRPARLIAAAIATTVVGACVGFHIAMWADFLCAFGYRPLRAVADGVLLLGIVAPAVHVRAGLARWPSWLVPAVAGLVYAEVQPMCLGLAVMARPPGQVAIVLATYGLLVHALGERLPS